MRGAGEASATQSKAPYIVYSFKGSPLLLRIIDTSVSVSPLCASSDSVVAVSTGHNQLLTTFSPQRHRVRIEKRP
jgi:ABC-type sulfate transport system permease subunit